MDVQFTAEQEAALTRAAARAGKAPAEYVQDAVAKALADEVRFLEAVEAGFASLDEGRFVSHEEVGKRLERRFQ